MQLYIYIYIFILQVLIKCHHPSIQPSIISFYLEYYHLLWCTLDSHMDFKAEMCGHKLQHCYFLVTSSLEFYSNSLSFNSSTKINGNDSNTHLTGCCEELKYTTGLAHQELK